MADENIIKLEADASKAIAEFEKLKTAATTTEEQISAGFAEASASADRFANAVATGSKGAERALALTVVQIEKLEAEIVQLKAQGKPTAVLEAGVESLRAKLALGTAQLGRFKAAAADAADSTRKATQRAGEFSGSITDVTGTLKTLSPALGNAIDKYSILAAKAFVAVRALQLGTEALKEVTKATGNYSGATKDAVDSASGFASALASFDFAGAIRSAGAFIGTMHTLTQATDETTTALGNLADAANAKAFAGVLKVQGDLVAGHEREVAALNVKAEALSREIATQQEAGEVQKYVRDEVQKTVDAYAAAGEAVPANLAAQADALGIVAKAQASTEASAKKLEEVSVAGSAARANAEVAASAEIVAAIERERVALEAKLATQQQILDAALAKGSKLDDSTDTTEAQKNLEDLKGKIRELENQPLISPDQVNSLNEMKDAAARLGREVSDLNNVFTVGNEDFLDQAQAADAASAAWDVYRTRLEQAQNRHEKANAAIEDSGDVLDELGETADDAGESLEDAADAAGELGDEAKKGADKAKEGLAGLKEGAEEAIPLLETIKGLLAEIKQAASEVDL